MNRRAFVASLIAAFSARKVVAPAPAGTCGKHEEREVMLALADQWAARTWQEQYNIWQSAMAETVAPQAFPVLKFHPVAFSLTWPAIGETDPKCLIDAKFIAGVEWSPEELARRKRLGPAPTINRLA